MLVNLNTSSGTNIIEDTRGPSTPAAAAVTTTASIALAANTARASYTIYNAGPNAVYIREGAAPVATATAPATPLYNVIIPPGFFWKEPFQDARFTGDIHAVCASGTASLQVSQGLLTT